MNEATKLTLEEMLALAKKVRLWEKTGDNPIYQSRMGWHKGINLVIFARRCPGAPLSDGIHYEIEANYNGTRVGIATCTEYWAVDGASRKAIPPWKESFSAVFSMGYIPRRVVPPENEGTITYFKEIYGKNKFLHKEEWTREEEQYFQEAKQLAREAMGK